MKIKLYLTAIVLFISQLCYAESWTYKQGEVYFAPSFYYAYNKPTYSDVELFDSIYRVKNQNIRMAQTFDWQYGIMEDLSAGIKLDIGYERERIYVQYNNDTLPTQFFDTNVHYIRTIPEFEVRKQLAKDEYRVLANSWSYTPGDLISASHTNYNIHRNSAVETRLQYGQSYKHEFWFSKYFRDYKNSELSHFFEWELGLKYYPEARHFEIPFDLRFHFRPGSNWAFEVALYNKFNKYNYDKKPYKMPHLAGLINNFSGASSDDKLYILDSIAAFGESESTDRSHNLNLRIDYYITNSQTIGLEGSTSVFSSPDFKNQALLLNYSISY